MNLPTTEPTLATRVRDQVQRMLEDAAFQSSSNLARLFRYLVEETLAGRADPLKAYTLAVEALGQPASFDPQTSALVRVQAGRLRALLDRYYRQDGRADPLRLVIPKGGYAVQFQAPAAPLPTDLPPEAGGLLRMPYGPVLAVAPCRHPSGDDRSADFGEGMTQEIIHLLTQCRELYVLALDTMGHYRQRHATARDWRNELGADYVLNSSLRLDGNRVRVTATLTDTETGVCLWTQRYDQTLTMADLFEVQDDIAQRIAALLGQPHGVVQRLVRRKPLPDLDAYTAVLRFYEYLENFSVENHARTREALERAVERDPGYAEAWGCLAIVHAGEHMFGFNPRLDDAPPLERARTAALRALKLDPHSITGHYALALSHYYRREMALFRETTERALHLAPNRSDILANLGLHLAYDGQWERGLALLDKARLLNPLHPGWYWFPYALDHYRRGQYAEALRAAHRLHLPNFFWEPLFIAMICGQLGREEEARTALARLLALRPDLATAAAEVIEIIVLDSALVAHCVEGLRKAGLQTAC